MGNEQTTEGAIPTEEIPATTTAAIPPPPHPVQTTHPAVPAHVYGILEVTVTRGLHVTPHSEKREVYLRVGWADPHTLQFLDENRVRRSGTDKKSNAPQWNFHFKETLLSPQVLKIEIWDNKRHLSHTGTFLGYSVIDWPWLKSWWRTGRSTAERRLEVLDPPTDKPDKSKPLHQSAPGIYVKVDYIGEKSLSPEDEVLGINVAEVGTGVKEFGRSVTQAWDEFTSSVAREFATVQTQVNNPPPAPGQPQQRYNPAQPPEHSFLGVSKSDVKDQINPFGFFSGK